MVIESLPIYGSKPTSTTFEVTEDVRSNTKWVERRRKILGPRTLTLRYFPPIKVELDHPTCLPREIEGTLTLKEFHNRVASTAPYSQVVIVIHTEETNNYRLNNTEVVNLLDYEIDKGVLTFWSVDISKGKLIEYSQIANAFFEEPDGEVNMVKKHYNQFIKINSATPIFLDTTYGRKKVDNVITFSGHIGSSEKPQLYIGLVIDE